MRKIIIEAEMSVDGAMGGENMDFWSLVFPYHTPDVEAYLSDLLFMPDALLMGQKTYTFFAQVWPEREGKQAERINSMHKFVASRTLEEPLQWNAELIKGDVAEAIRKLKQEPGGSLLQYGVGELTHTMLRHGLVDEFRFVVYPFAYGEGPRIFEHMGAHHLKLLDTRVFNSGAIALHYQPQQPG
ncbi:MAG: dihydrofolate reductase [Chloroflexi bacterium]|jgi:dihydrofolate reductase|nr:dihydrofolate reductase [Chloroflexota bacterium]